MCECYFQLTTAVFQGASRGPTRSREARERVRACVEAGGHAPSEGRPAPNRAPRAKWEGAGPAARLRGAGRGRGGGAPREGEGEGQGRVPGWLGVQVWGTPTIATTARWPGRRARGGGDVA